MTPQKFLACLLIGAQLCVAAPALATPPDLPDAPKPVPGEVDVGAAISPMRKGQLAPFTGVLLSPKALATVVTELNSLQERIKIEVDLAVGVAEARCDFKVAETENRLGTDKRIMQAQLDENQKRIAILNEQLKKEEDNRTNTPLWVGLGVGGGLVVGVAVTVLATFAVNSASK